MRRLWALTPRRVRALLRARRSASGLPADSSAAAGLRRDVPIVDHSLVVERRDDGPDRGIAG